MWIELAALVEGIIQLQCNCARPLTPPTGTTQSNIQLSSGSTMRFNKPRKSTLTQKLRQNTSYVQLGAMNAVIGFERS